MPNITESTGPLVPAPVATDVPTIEELAAARPLAAWQTNGASTTASATAGAVDWKSAATGAVSVLSRTNLSRLRARFQQVTGKGIVTATTAPTLTTTATTQRSAAVALAQASTDNGAWTTTGFRASAAGTGNARAFRTVADPLVPLFDVMDVLETTPGLPVVEDPAELDLSTMGLVARHLIPTVPASNVSSALDEDDFAMVPIAKKAESEPELDSKPGKTLAVPQPPQRVVQVALPMKLRAGDKPVLALDIDESLCHSAVVPRKPADFWIEVIQNNDVRTREVFWVYKRPGVDAFLRAVAQHYTVLAFTAGIREYASQILDHLDPDGTIFAGRLYRDSCTDMRGGLVLPAPGAPVTPSTYAKDMTKVCDDMSRIILVDNTPGCFALQPANGLPVKSWYSDPYDQSLPRLQEFLIEVKDVADLRLVLPEWRM
ncbi:dullard-like phosphatase domain-containing protein [Allomyces macrogynus ATCC 38327]|uniref:Mitochondrial import inner membrane translocase subunit TIM50 n=1 Tax=Allomyces macrogynus (strain ATCC 38327) TaxID=578462 RepID=A0A0L0S635_ALLM3|nr:dullard-like phosphatase domain-containing protein [Allomyces macrogynus ATCC 38327]|eukprot:KNE57829.1 dullard-like phosphatase domain-containing protein [Allomyces macrogynus ATCC 38327]